MILYEQGMAYWQIAKRCHAHRATNPAIVPTAVRDMQRLLPETRCDAVKRRINSFIARNSKRPGTSPDGDGPRFA